MFNNKLLQAGIVILLLSNAEGSVYVSKAEENLDVVINARIGE